MEYVTYVTDLILDIIKRSEEELGNPKCNRSYYMHLLEYKIKCVGIKIEYFKKISVTQVNYELGSDFVDLKAEEIIRLLEYYNQFNKYGSYKAYEEFIKDTSYIDDLVPVDKED